MVQKMFSDGRSAYHDFESHRNLQSLEQAISKFEALAETTPQSDPNLPVILKYLGDSFQCRFEQLGMVADVNNAIERLEMAICLTPDGHPEKPAYLSNLGISLQSRFERLGNLFDLDSAITKQQLAVNLTPDGHPDKPSCVTNLGGSLHRRFERLGNLSDLDSAITAKQLAVNLTPDGHPDKPSRLNNLGNSLHRRFERVGNLSDLNGAISQLQSSVDLTPDGHPHKPDYLSNLGYSLQTRFERLGNLSDLESAIAQLESSVDLTPDGHPHKLGHLNNLGGSLLRRFQRLGNLSDLDAAITRQQLSVNLTPDGYPDKPDYLFNHGAALLTRFSISSHLNDAAAAITHWSASAQSSVGSPTTRLKAAQGWIYIASLVNHHSLSNAYECVVGLMPVVAWLGLPIRDRHESLVQISEIARDAAAAAISLEKYDKALEWLEQGRSIVWNQILQLRTPVDELREINPNLADRLLRVSRILHRGGEEKGSLGSIEENAQRHRALTMEWESILKEIRSLPSFEDFLKPLRASRLREAAQNGPVIIINVAKKRCDVLALVPGMDEVIHIPLPDMTYNKVVELGDGLKDHLYSSGIRMRGERAAQKWIEQEDSNDWTGILTELWNGLVKPVLDSLAFSVGYVSTFAPHILTMLSLASARCITTYMVVPNRTTRLPPDTCRRYL
jgi:tetratricopeptide (TPR) repeat protein